LKEIADANDMIIAVLRPNDTENAAHIIQEHIMLIWSRIGNKSG
jgi:hypothetical protein